jgi:large subunit ribosomal protein L15
MRVDQLAPSPGSTKPKRRVGRGIGGKGGKTAGSGTKGQQSRGRGKVARGFEGGQMPLKQRVPKLKGFNNPFRVEYHVVNLSTLDAFDANAEVSPDTLRRRGLVAKQGLVKVLANGELSKPLTVKAHAFSAAAARSIEAAGGSTEVLPLPWKTGRPPVRGNAHANR